MRLAANTKFRFLQLSLESSGESLGSSLHPQEFSKHALPGTAPGPLGTVTPSRCCCLLLSCKLDPLTWQSCFLFCREKKITPSTWPLGLYTYGGYQGSAVWSWQDFNGSSLTALFQRGIPMPCNSEMSLMKAHLGNHKIISAFHCPSLSPWVEVCEADFRSHEEFSQVVLNPLTFGEGGWPPWFAV